MGGGGRQEGGRGGRRRRRRREAGARGAAPAAGARGRGIVLPRRHREGAGGGRRSPAAGEERGAGERGRGREGKAERYPRQPKRCRRTPHNRGFTPPGTFAPPARGRGGREALPPPRTWGRGRGAPLGALPPTPFRAILRVSGKRWFEARAVRARSEGGSGRARCAGRGGKRSGAGGGERAAPVRVRGCVRESGGGGRGAGLLVSLREKALQAMSSHHYVAFIYPGSAKSGDALPRRGSPSGRAPRCRAGLRGWVSGGAGRGAGERGGQGTRAGNGAGFPGSPRQPAHARV